MSMFKIHKYTNQIDLTRGNTMKTEIDIDTEDGVYVPAADDVIRFVATKKKDDTNAIIEKTIPHEMVLELLPDDTKNLDRGAYFYKVEVTLGSGEVYTVIEGKLILEGMRK